MSPLTFLMVLVYACAASAATKNDTKSVTKLRTFGLFPVTGEPIPFNWYEDYEEVRQNHSVRVVARNKTSILRLEVSEEALLFLTGPLSTILIPSFYTLVCLISLPINICAVVAFSLKIRPKKPAAIYMLNLACADLLFAALLPFKIIYHFSGNHWVFGPFMCRMVTAAFYWNMYCSVLLIACISVDRLLAVVYPIDSLAWRRPRNSIIACAAMWILSLAGTVPLVLSDHTVHLSQLNITTCHDVLPAHEQIWKYRIYFITLSCALFFLPLLITLGSYTRVIWSLSRVPKGVIGRSRRRTRAVVMAVTVLVIFVLCFMPTNCLLLAHYLQYTAGLTSNQQSPDGSYAAYLVFMCLGSLNCLLDPLVYYFGSSQCQRQLGSTLGCHKISESGSFSKTSSDSCRSSARPILKSSRTQSSKNNTTVTDVDSLQTNHNSLYKKLLL